MIKRFLITAIALFTAVGFVGSTIAAPVADPADTTTAPAKKKTTKKKTPAKKKTTKKKTPAPTS